MSLKAQSHQPRLHTARPVNPAADKILPATTALHRGGASESLRSRGTATTLRVPPMSRPVGITAPATTQTPAAPGALLDRRRRRRAQVPPMYTEAIIRVLSRREEPIEAHVRNVSETGIALEADALVPVGHPVAIEFQVAGMGKMDRMGWAEFTIAGEVVRLDDVDDFPGGPYRIAVRFVQISTMMQANIARFVATHPCRRGVMCGVCRGGFVGLDAEAVDFFAWRESPLRRGIPTLLMFVFLAAGLWALVAWLSHIAPIDAQGAASDAALIDRKMPEQGWGKLRVMTGNIRVDMPQDGKNSWINRRELLVKTFLKYQPDVLGCQEVAPAQGAYVGRALAAWYGYCPRAGVGSGTQEATPSGAISSAVQHSPAAQLVGAAGELLSSLNTLYYRSDRFDLVDGESGLILPDQPQAIGPENTFLRWRRCAKAPPARRRGSSGGRSSRWMPIFGTMSSLPSDAPRRSRKKSGSGWSNFPAAA